MCPLWVLCDFICLAHAFGIQALPNVTLRGFFFFCRCSYREGSFEIRSVRLPENTQNSARNAQHRVS